MYSQGRFVQNSDWFRADLCEYLQDTLMAPTALSKEHLQPAYVAMLVREHLEGARNHGLRLWTLLTFEVWLKLIRQKAWQ